MNLWIFIHNTPYHAKTSCKSTVYMVQCIHKKRGIVMEKKIEKIIFHTCAYAVITSVLFFIFAAIAGMESTSISIGRYFLIIGFSLLIALSELIFGIKALNKLVCYLIHFSALFIAFLVVFILINEQSFKPSFILSSLVIFTLCYALILGLTHLYKRVRTKAAKHDATAKSKEKSQPTYTSRFS